MFITNVVTEKKSLLIEMYDEHGEYALHVAGGVFTWSQQAGDGTYYPVKDEELAQELQERYRFAKMDKQVSTDWIEAAIKNKKAAN